MKFTKEQAVEKITADFKSKVEKIDDWKRTIEENVNTLCDLLGEESEIELDDFSKKCVSLLETSKGHLNKVVADTSQDLNNQIEELKKKVNQKEPTKPKEKPKNEELEALVKKVEELEAKQATEANEKIVKSKRSELAAELKKRGVKNEKWIEAMLSEADINAETDVDAKAKRLLEIYNKFASNIPEEDPNPKVPITPSREEAIKKAIEDAGKLAKNEI